MRKIFTSFIAVIAIVALGWFLIPRVESRHEKKKAPTEAQDYEGYSHWIYPRLADPATGRIPNNIRKKELAFAATLPKANYLRRDNQWKSRGPWNVGGRTRALGIDVNDESHYIAGSVSGGIWETEDAGQSWTKRTAADQLHAVTCLTQDTRPGHQNVWYYGSGEAYGASQSATGAYFLGDGLFKSTDNGKTWQQIASTANNTPSGFNSVWELVWNIATDRSVDSLDVVYAATYGYIHRSEDGGATWPNVLGTGNSYFTDVATTSQGVVYATLSSDGGNKGIWRSPDGKSWTRILPDSFPPSYQRMVIGIDPNDENTVYILAHTDGYGQLQLNYRGDEEWNSLWRYTYLQGNGADTNGIWVNLSDNLPQDTVHRFNGFNAQGSYNMVVVVQPGNSNNVFIGGTNIYRSTDGFTTSNNTAQIGGYKIDTHLPLIEPYKNNHSDEHTLNFLPSNPNVLLNGSDGGVYRTMDCLADTVEWEVLDNGYLTTQFYTVTIDHSKTNNIIIGGLQDNNVRFINSTDQEEDWTTPLFGDGSYCAIAPNGYTYVSKQLGKTYKMDLDANGNVNAFRRMDPIGGRYDFINPFVIDPNNPNRMYMLGLTRLWINDSLDQIPLSNEWDSISTGWRYMPDTLSATGLEYSAIAISTSPPNRVYLGTNNKKMYRIDNAHQLGAQRTEITYPAVGSTSNINCIAVDPEDADHIMAIISNYNIYSILYSEDGGQSWEKAGGNLEENSFGTGNGPSCRWADMLHLPDGKTIYFVGTSTGLYATDTIEGLNTVWIQMAPDLIGNVVVDMVKTRDADGLVVVGTHGGGVYSANITSWDILTGIRKANQPATLDAKVYPNPAQGNAWLDISADKEAKVDIRIYDILGRNYGSIYHGSIGTVQQKIPIELTNLPAGNYYVVINSGNQGRALSLIRSR